MTKAVIVDDEYKSVKTLEFKLNKFCDDIDILGKFTDPGKALNFLNTHSIDILFLDIEMPHINGFELLNGVEEIKFEVIFTTAYDQYAIKAIKFSALDYLLKPIQADELQRAVEKFRLKKKPGLSSEQLDNLVHQVKSKFSPGRIALSTQDSIEFVLTDDIIMCTSDSNYTNVFLADGRKKFISRTLKDFEELLTDHNFFRVHHSHLINLHHVKEYIRKEGGYLMLSNKLHSPVSRNKKDELMKRINI